MNTTEMNPVAVEVVSIKNVNKGSLKAFVTVKIAGKITIHSLRIVQQAGQDAWVSMPQAEVPQANGAKTKYYAIIEINDEHLKRQIIEAALRSWTPPLSNPRDEAGSF